MTEHINGMPTEGSFDIVFMEDLMQRLEYESRQSIRYLVQTGRLPRPRRVRGNLFGWPGEEINRVMSNNPPVKGTIRGSKFGRVSSASAGRPDTKAEASEATGGRRRPSGDAPDASAEARTKPAGREAR